MSRRNGVVPVVASGTATAVKLLVATLAFAGAYVGVGAANGGAPATGAGTRTVTLSARAVPVTTALVPRAGVVTVSQRSLAPCEKRLRARGVVRNPAPDQVVLYGWRLQRWSHVKKTWRTYLSSSSGFTGPAMTTEWRPDVVGNPGWYRVELTVRGGKPVRSERFRISC
ncbi:hypothetical protein Misp01_74980 [Microtetraspora sp. NBRC 13810]|uniref:hypothetical protein n=1 Tax=Microtetraspora sp. NBRC 13810 TaxID=3030990 RepID=UPI0024A259C7|nr:hypothetical protein [Microtetraspora sp. NBRC 13810]GLW12370.1 hypothetical protein Misp01_74980 [Microtetraspora sp. NBRC 13810]